MARDEHDTTGARGDEGAEEELRWVKKKKKGAHRPGSKGTRGYERGLWKGDGDNSTQGPSESRPTDDVLEEQEAAKTRGVDEDPHVNMSPGKRILYEALMVVAEAAIEVLSDPEVHEALAVRARDAGRTFSGYVVRKIDGLRQKQDRSTSGIEPPSVSARKGPDETVPGATDDRASRLKITQEQYRAVLHAALAFEEQAAWLKQQLRDIDVDDSELPDELAAAVQAALAGHVSELSPEQHDLLMAFLDEATINGEEYELVDPDDPAGIGRGKDGKSAV